MLDITILPILEDNYCYIIQSNNLVGIIDPGEAKPVIAHLEKHNLKPDYIFNTHHHWDHVNGNKAIKQKYSAQIIAPKSESTKIKNSDIALSHDQTFTFGDEEIKIIKVAGHTMGHICFYFEKSKALFSGDALFSMGCGRLFEGNADDLFKGFEILRQLPDDTQIYCGHEYTETNGKFCLSVEPDNQDLIARYDEVIALRQANQPTIPTTLGLEKKTNLFLRAQTAEDLKILRDLKDKA